MNLLQLSAIAHDKASSIQFLQQHGILHNQRTCSRHHDMILSVTNVRERWRCNHRECRENIPVRKNTWLQGSKLSFRQVVLFIY